MTKSRVVLLLALTTLVVVGLGAAAWLFLAPGADQNSPPLVNDPVIASQLSAADPGDGTRTSTILEVPAVEQQATTVVFALKVEIELVRSTASIAAAGVPALGSAATARLKGSVHTTNDQAVRATVHFTAGANQGRVLACDGNGQFGATDLYPGLSIVSVQGPGIPGALREVRLRQPSPGSSGLPLETQLNLGFGRCAEVWGQVFGKDGNPLADADVTFDGQEQRTDEKGLFHYLRVAPGAVLVYVEKPGYASYREELNLAASATLEQGKLKYTLQPAARLEIEIADRLESDKQAQIFLLPSDATAQRKFPWHKLNPVKCYPGGTVTLEDLPAGSITLRTFHAGAVAKPAESRITLEPGITSHVTLHLEPAPAIHGIVRHDGQPVANAEVSLEAPDRYRAMLAAFGSTDFMFLESEVIPDAPPAFQRSFTDALGRYTLSAFENVSKERYLVARADGGKLGASHVLRMGESTCDLDLVSTATGNALLRLQLGERTQGLPIEVRVNGAPREPFTLPPGQDLRIDQLSEGEWTLSATWNGEVVQPKVPITIHAETVFTFPLPEGALAGQDANTRARSGKK